MLTRARLFPPVTPGDFGASDDRPRSGGIAVARHLHAQAARGHSGVFLIVPEAPEAPQHRIGLRRGFVYAIDAGPSAPVSPEAALRYLLRQRGRSEFVPTTQLSARYAVDEFRPDLPIRQHIEAQALPKEHLRQRIGSRRIAAINPPHASALHPEEQHVLRLLGEPRTVPELLEHGARSGDFSPLRAMQLLVLLDALGSLVIGDIGGAQAEAHALLGLPMTATLDDVKLAYRRLARTLHPDSNPQVDAAARRELTDRFTALHAAYRLLVQQKSGGAG
jgi:hypothetical protein